MNLLQINLEIELPAELDAEAVRRAAEPAIVRVIEQSARCVMERDVYEHPDVREHYRLIELMKHDVALARTLAADSVSLAPAAAAAMREAWGMICQSILVI